MKQGHGAHQTGFVRDEESQPRQEVLCAILGRVFLLDRRAIGCDLANDVECGVSEGVVGRRTGVVCEKRSRELCVVWIGYRDVCDDGQLETWMDECAWGRGVARLTSLDVWTRSR